MRMKWINFKWWLFQLPLRLFYRNYSIVKDCSIHSDREHAISNEESYNEQGEYDSMIYLKLGKAIVLSNYVVCK